jgi:hypothetical protein
MTLTFASIEILAIEVFQQSLIVELSIPTVNLRNLAFQVSQISFRETSHHKELLDSALSLGLRELKDSVDALLFGIVDEATGVDYNNLALGIVAVVGTLIAVSLHQSHQRLTIHEILGTSK